MKKVDRAIDLWFVKTTCLGYIDGIAICDPLAKKLSQSTFLQATREAMNLIRKIDPRRYRLAFLEAPGGVARRSLRPRASAFPFPKGILALAPKGQTFGYAPFSRLARRFKEMQRGPCLLLK